VRRRRRKVIRGEERRSEERVEEKIGEERKGEDKRGEVMRGEENREENREENGEKVSMPAKMIIATTIAVTITAITVMTYLTSHSKIRTTHSHRRERAQETPARWWTFPSQAPDIRNINNSVKRVVTSIADYLCKIGNLMALQRFNIIA
jgi:hypothetical protein